MNMLGGMFGGEGMGLGPMNMGFGGHGHSPAPPSAFNKPYRAYSSAIHEIQQGRGNAGAHVTDGGRTQVMFGGQIMMPPSALRHLTELDIEGPWTFELINPIKRHLKTHAGVLEFTADEGVVYLPSWMMKRLELSEGGAIRLFGSRLPKGKLVKLQAQSVTFLELSDPKAVLEQAFRSYTALTEGDIIEISYNMMTFELLIMEIQPAGAAISIINTDLEVDFAPPKGYVEPERKPAAPVATMASKLKINTDQTQDVDHRGSGTQTPVGGAGPAGHGGRSWEAFKGTGQSMGGKRVKGKGISIKKVEEVEKDSKIFRTGGPKIVTADTQIGNRKVPAALHLPEGVLFFGYRHTPPPKDNNDEKAEKVNEGGHKPPAFTGAGAGVTLSGRASRRFDQPVTAGKGKGGGGGATPEDIIQIDSD